MVVTYDSVNGLSMPDDKWIEWCNDSSNFNNDISIGCELAIELIRLKIAKKELNHENISFMFDNVLISVDYEGNLNSWPKGFCDKSENIITQLFKIRIHNSKKKGHKHEI